MKYLLYKLLLSLQHTSVGDISTFYLLYLLPLHLWTLSIPNQLYYLKNLSLWNMYSVSYYSLNNIVYQLFIWHLHYTVLRVIYKRGNIYRRIFIGYKEVWWHFILAIPASVGFGVSRTSWAQSTNIERWLLLSPHLTTMMALVLRKQSSYHRKEAELSLNPSSECLQRL